MITFVVNLHLGIPSMALAEPFLYSLQKEGKIKLIFEPNNNITERIERAAMEVRKHLERSAFIKWQVVFLVNIADNPQSPFKDSLSGQMLLIRKLFLENKWLNDKPVESYIIALDLVNDDDAIPDIQKSKIYRDSWELDTTGFIRNKQRFFITEEKINALDHIWKSKVKLSEKEVINGTLGFGRLTFEMQETVTNTVGEIYHEIRQLLDVEKIDFQRYTVVKNIDYIDANLIEEIKKEFWKRLENTKNDPSRYNNFSPADTLRSCIAEHLGIFADENAYTFRLMRFPFQWSHTDILQRNLIKLSVLLSLIVEQEDIIKSLSNKNYLVKVKLDDRQVQQVAYNYMENLYNMQKHLTFKLQNPEPIELALLNGGDCSCSQVLDKNNPSLLTFGFLRKNGDLPKWKDWNKRIKQNLEAYSRQARRKMQTCIDKNHKENTEPTVVTEKDIDTKADDLKRIKNTLQNEVEHNFLSKAFAYDWNKYEAEQEALLKPSLFNRPTKNELILTVFVAAIIFGISFSNANLQGKGLEQSALYYAIIFAIGVLLGVISLFWAKREYQASLNGILQNVFEKARQLRLDIYNEFERQKKYLKSLCELNTVRKNYETVNNRIEQRNQDNLLLDYHRRQLEEHQAMAQKILDIFKADEQHLHNQFNEEFSKVDVNLPMHENKIYAPNTFINYKMKKEQKNAQIENTTYLLKNKLGNLVDSIVFSHDRIYNKETRL